MSTATRPSTTPNAFADAVGSPSAAPTPESPAANSHPLPTLNLAKETKLPAARLRIREVSRRYLTYQADATVEARMMERLAERVSQFMGELGLAQHDYATDLRDFMTSFAANPAAGAARTTAPGSLVWLFLFVRALDPALIVESGVFKGASLFTLRSASASAALHAYDIDLTNLLFAHESISFHEGDWGEFAPRALGPNDLCYFDDHINNCLRLRQAHTQGFRHVIIDDSPDIGELHRWRFPGVPTAQMVYNRSLLPGESVEWVWKDRHQRYTYREEHSHGVQEILGKVVQLPNLSGFTGRAAGTQTYVHLKE